MTDHGKQTTPREWQCDCAACEGFRQSHPATRKAWAWLSDHWKDMEPARRISIADSLREIESIFRQWENERV